MSAGKNVELFSCAGGMAEGFRRAGIHFDIAVDFMEDHCGSYEANLGHRPVRMDVRDLLRMAKLGLFAGRINLLVADPPCTPWSRAGLRKGTSDERDMLKDTCELIRLLRPHTYLIGNVPGLDDSKNWHVVQKEIGSLQKLGYCVADFAALDAANYGTPQHRIRPFWYGHLEGPCIRWPQPSHCDPAELHTLPLPGIERLLPWVTCRQALGHLSEKDLGRPVRLRRRACNSSQHGSVADRPARVVGTSNLSDGNVLLSERHPPAELDLPSPTLGAKEGGQGGQLLRRQTRHERGGGKGHSAPEVVLVPQETDSGRKGKPRARDKGRIVQGMRIGDAEVPSKVITDKGARVGAGAGVVIKWPWDAPSTTVQADPRIAPPGHHDESYGNVSVEGAVVLSELAAKILQGFPESWVFVGKSKRARWSQLGQAMPPQLSHAVARSVSDQHAATQSESTPSLATGKLTVV